MLKSFHFSVHKQLKALCFHTRSSKGEISALVILGVMFLVGASTTSLTWFINRQSTENRSQAAYDPGSCSNEGGSCKSSCAWNDDQIGVCSLTGGSVCCKPNAATQCSAKGGLCQSNNCNAGYKEEGSCNNGNRCCVVDPGYIPPSTSCQGDGTCRELSCNTWEEDRGESGCGSSGVMRCCKTVAAPPPTAAPTSVIPTPIPTACPLFTETVSSLSPSGVINPGYYNVKWSVVNGATKYTFAFDDLANSWGGCGGNGGADTCATVTTNIQGSVYFAPGKAWAWNVYPHNDCSVAGAQISTTVYVKSTACNASCTVKENCQHLGSTFTCQGGVCRNSQCLNSTTCNCATPTFTTKPTATKTPTKKPTVANTTTLKPTATRTPTKKPTAANTATLKPSATRTPTKKPTATVTPVCNTGAKRCIGSTLQTCNKARNGYDSLSCSFGCVNNACKPAPTATKLPTKTPSPICQTGTYRCSNNTEYYCQNGYIERSFTCQNGCQSNNERCVPNPTATPNLIDSITRNCYKVNLTASPTSACEIVRNIKGIEPDVCEGIGYFDSSSECTSYYQKNRVLSPSPVPTATSLVQSTCSSVNTYRCKSSVQYYCSTQKREQPLGTTYCKDGYAYECIDDSSVALPCSSGKCDANGQYCLADQSNTVEPSPVPIVSSQNFCTKQSDCIKPEICLYDLDKRANTCQIEVVTRNAACYYGSSTCAHFGRESANGCGNSCGNSYSVCCGEKLPEYDKICQPGASVCETDQRVKVCANNGAEWLNTNCSQGLTCANGTCVGDRNSCTCLNEGTEYLIGQSFINQSDNSCHACVKKTEGCAIANLGNTCNITEISGDSDVSNILLETLKALFPKTTFLNQNTQIESARLNLVSQLFQKLPSKLLEYRTIVFNENDGGGYAYLDTDLVFVSNPSCDGPDSEYYQDPRINCGYGMSILIHELTHTIQDEVYCENDFCKSYLELFEDSAIRDEVTFESEWTVTNIENGEDFLLFEQYPTDILEGMAITSAAYVMAPEKLKENMPEIYNFFKDTVYEGVEYTTVYIDVSCKKDVVVKTPYVDLGLFYESCSTGNP